MEYMDVDQILDVPDTPDRIPAQNIFWGNYSSVTNHSRAKELPDEGVRNRPTENGTQRLLFRPSKSPSISDKSDCHVGSSVSTSVTNHSRAKDLSDGGVRNQLPTENGTQRLLFQPSKSPNFSDKSDHHVSSSVSTSVTNHSRAKDLSDEGVENQLPTENRPQRIMFRPSKSPNISDKSDCHVGSSVSTSVTNHSRAKDLADEGIRNRPTENGTQRLLFRPSKCPSISDKLENHVGSSVSTLVTNHSRAKDLSDEGVRNRPTENGTQRVLFQPSKSLNISDKSDRHDGSSVTTLRNSSSPKNALPLKRKEKGKGICTSNSDRAEEFRKLFIPTNALSSSRVPTNSSSACNVDEKCKPGLSSDRGKGIGLVVDSQPKVGKIGQRRLVRNGCISPLNIAKVKQSTDNPNNGPVRVGPGDIGTVASEGQPGQIYIRDLVTEPIDSHRVRGKVVINHPLPSKGPDEISSRGSKTSNEKNTDGTGNSSGDGYKSVGEDLGGWRSTRNRTKNTNPPSSSVPPFMQTVQPANARFKRRKQGPTSSAHGECSTSNFDDSELVCLGSSVEPSNLRSTGARNRNGPGSLDPVIEIDEFSPQARNSSSSNLGCSHNDDSEIRARQLEADEILARELQEELYNELPVVGAPVGQIDANIALALQQQESSQRAVPSRSRAVRPRNSLISNLRRQSQSSSSRNPTIRRGTPVRAPTSTRMARLRARFPGQPRTLSSSSSLRGGNPLFPPNMDLDMRMHILETLEAFSDMGMPGGGLQVQRDFNENDYEMLLALDENNHQHGGASVARINGLPQSTVQSENHQEVCAICLDTPTIGDTIRHLPCFHKFHKDCIDPWLRRKTSCPVCKSSIT